MAPSHAARQGVLDTADGIRGAQDDGGVLRNGTARGDENSRRAYRANFGMDDDAFTDELGRDDRVGTCEGAWTWELEIARNQLEK